MATSIAALHERAHYAQRIGPTVRMAVGATSKTTDGAGGSPSPLVIGARYAILCPETGFYLRQGSAGVVASAADRYLPPSNFALITVDSLDDNRVAVLDADGLGGYAYLTRLDSLDGVERGDPAALKASFFAPKCGGVQTVAAGGTSARSGALSHGGRFYVDCPSIPGVQDGDSVWLKQGSSSVVVAATPGADLGMYLPAGTGFTFVVDDITNDCLAARSATGGNGSSIRITRIDAVT